MDDHSTHTCQSLPPCLQEQEKKYVLIFKSNIRYKKDVKIIEPVLNAHPSIIKWNIDKHDIDKVLRIESVTNNVTIIINIIKHVGYWCEELSD